MKFVRPKERTVPTLSRRFRRIYERHIKAILRRYLRDGEYYTPIAYTLYSGRNRFRAAMPFLFSGGSARGAILGAVGEFMWAVALVYDDIGDESDVRRGRPAAWREFGLLYASHSAGIGLLLAEKILRDHRFSDQVVALLKKRFETAMKAQIDQAQMSLKTPLRVIVENYRQKGMFGNWSLEAALSLNQQLAHSQRKKILALIFDLSVAAQIKNDLLDFLYEPQTGLCMRDVRGGIPTYPTILFMHCASLVERKRFTKEIWANKRKSLAELRAACLTLFQKRRVLETSQATIRSIASSVISRFGGVHDEAMRATLIQWASSYLKT